MIHIALLAVLLAKAAAAQATTTPPLVIPIPIPPGCTGTLTPTVFTLTCKMNAPPPPPPPTFSITTPVALPAGTSGTFYTVPLAPLVKPTGGVAPYTFAAGPGFPAWLTLTPTGVLSGTPPAAGTFTIQFTVTDSSTNGGASASFVNFGVDPNITIR